MSKTAYIVWSCIGIVLAVGAMVSAVAWGYISRPAEEPCAAVEYNIADRAERLYLTEGELTALLREQDLYPVGRKLNNISLQRIEKAVAAHPMVRTAECYLTPRNVVYIRLTQRVPLLYVSVPGRDGYFIDTDRRVMPLKATVRDQVLVVTGMAGVQMASTQLADFAGWLQEEPYWRSRIRRVHVQTPYQLVIYLRDPALPRVILGEMNGYERKLCKLRTFFEKGTEATAGKRYEVLDIRFRGQVIGRGAQNENN